MSLRRNDYGSAQWIRSADRPAPQPRTRASVAPERVRNGYQRPGAAADESAAERTGASVGPEGRTESPGRQTDQRRRMYSPPRTRASVGPEGRTERRGRRPISGGGCIRRRVPERVSARSVYGVDISVQAQRPMNRPRSAPERVCARRALRSAKANSDSPRASGRSWAAPRRHRRRSRRRTPSSGSWARTRAAPC